ncbi:diphosphomevalonate decarboxylase [Oenococcus oeni]|uniref:diphosphomevalonate decarboxylase n=1 Tax=Oenococcus oeni TaxID=1247 RepID=UPI0010BC2952|nr:diphosphomevalonate decarboxylase [Oenococcus oeni]SYW16713.1 Diphosphomevalonate decarboxylase [Oenococcus oeni]
MAKVRAYTNIALIKYWGKSDLNWNLPTSSSIGLTLDRFYTDTSVEIDQFSKKDFFQLNGQQIEGPKISKIINFIRNSCGNKNFVKVISENHVPTSAGLASSASAFAALTKAASQAFGLQLDNRELSKIARIGSGSASRSIFGGFSIWHKGQNKDDSFSESILDPVDFDIRVIDILADKRVKKISSSQGMQLAQTSPNYDSWLKKNDRQIDEMLKAISDHDLEKIGLIAEANSASMHELNRTAKVPFDYFTENTREIISEVDQLYKKGILAFATVDAGPNVKVITNSEYQEKIINVLKEYGEILVQKPGRGVADV